MTQCTSASRVQTRRHGVQLPAWTSTPVPVGFLPTGLRRHVAATSPLRQPITTGRAALHAQHLRPKGICRGWSVGVELSA